VQESSLQGIQPSVIAFDVVVILLRLAVIAQHLDFLSKIFIVRRNRSGFPACAQVLAGIEAKCRCASDRACFHPAVKLSRKVLGPVCLASIFNHDETVPVGDFLNRIHVGGLSVKVYRNDGGDWLAATTANELA
jgi:hypothetical protein